LALRIESCGSVIVDPAACTTRLEVLNAKSDDLRGPVLRINPIRHCRVARALVFMKRIAEIVGVEQSGVLRNANQIGLIHCKIVLDRIL